MKNCTKADCSICGETDRSECDDTQNKIIKKLESGTDADCNKEMVL